MSFNMSICARKFFPVNRLSELAGLVLTNKWNSMEQTTCGTIVPYRSTVGTEYATGGSREYGLRYRWDAQYVRYGSLFSMFVTSTALSDTVPYRTKARTAAP